MLSLFMKRASRGLVLRLVTREQMLVGLGPAGILGWSFCISEKWLGLKQRLTTPL